MYQMFGGNSYVEHLEESLQLDVPHMESATMSSGNCRWDGLRNLD